MKTRDEDFVTRLFVANTHTPILFFTSKGMVYQLKCYRLPVASPQSIGKAMVNLLPIAPDETIQTVMPLPSDSTSWDSLNIIFATSQGNIRRNPLSDFTNIMRNGKIAMKLSDDDSLIGVLPCQENDQVLMASRHGKAIRFDVNDVRLFRGRNSVGVRGMRLLADDEVMSICVIKDPDKEYVLSITENGYGKRTAVSEYRRTARGGQGVANIETSERNGQVVASFTVFAEDHLMLVTNAGKVIRIRVDGGEGDVIRIAGRKTQGVRLFEIDKSEQVVSVGVIRDADEDEEEGEADIAVETEAASLTEAPSEPSERQDS